MVAFRTRFFAAPGLLIAIGLSAAVVASSLVATPAQAGSPSNVLSVVDRPARPAVASGKTANIGMRFTASTSGVITAISFYRGPKQKRSYGASLWSSSGKRLAKVTLRASKKVGWQSASLRAPLRVAAGSTYVVSYLATGGHYPVTKGAFTATINHDGLTTARNAGRYRYAHSRAFPTHATKTNYFVDVVFVADPPPAPTDVLAGAATRRVFFGHQSVGWYVLNDGVTALYSQAKMAEPPQPTISQHGELISPSAGGVFADAYVGSNGDPDGKADDFAAYLRGGIAEQVDVAILKYCYVDIGSGTDVEAAFAHYQATMDALVAQFPQVKFIYATDPLTEGGGDNVARYRFNQLVRARYASTGRLWDVAALESTRPDGGRVVGNDNGQPYEELYAGYSRDGGHPNELGAKVLATDLLRLVAQS